MSIFKRLLSIFKKIQTPQKPFIILLMQKSPTTFLTQTFQTKSTQKPQKRIP